MPFNSGGTIPIVGTFREIVVTDTVTGDLDFLYEITNDGTTGDDFIGRFTATNFTGFTTDVGYAPMTTIDLIPPEPHMIPSGDDRGIPGPGATIGWNFLSAGGVPLLGYGTDSEVMVVKTNATDFTNTNVAVIDRGSFNLPGYGPTAAVPEPISLILLGSGLAGVGFFRRLRKPKG